jgi:hypothetical protein
MFSMCLFYMLTNTDKLRESKLRSLKSPQSFLLLKLTASILIIALLIYDTSVRSDSVNNLHDMFDKKR